MGGFVHRDSLHGARNCGSVLAIVLRLAQPLNGTRKLTLEGDLFKAIPAFPKIF